MCKSAGGFAGDSELAGALSAVSHSPASLWQSLFIPSRFDCPPGSPQTPAV